MDTVAADLVAGIGPGVRTLIVRAARRGRFDLRFCATRVVAGGGEGARIPRRKGPSQEHGRDADDDNCIVAHLCEYTTGT